MRDIFKVLEQIKEVLGEDNEYSEIKAGVDDIEYSLRFKAPEDVWGYVYDRLIVKFIPPETEIDYKVLSIWTTKSVAELKDYCEFTYTNIQKIKKYVEELESILDKVTEFIKDDVTTEDIKFEGSKLFSTVYKSLISKTKEKIVEGINSYKNQIENIIKKEKEINLTVFNSTLQ